MSRDEVLEQYAAFERLKVELGKAAAETEVERYLSDREEVGPETGLKPEAAKRFEERLGRSKQPG